MIAAGAARTAAGTGLGLAAILITSWVLRPLGAPAMVLAVGSGGVVALRRSPRTALAACVALLALGLIWVDPAEDQYDAWTVVPTLATAWALGSFGPAPRIAGAGLLGIACAGGAPGESLFIAVLCAGLSFLAAAAGAKRRHAVAAGRFLHEASARTTAEVAMQAVWDERSRIAADAQAVVRGSLARMGQRARAARHELAADRRRTAEVHLLAVEAEGRYAVADMRRLLGLLTAQGTDRDPSQPADSHRAGSDPGRPEPVRLPDWVPAPRWAWAGLAAATLAALELGIYGLAVARAASSSTVPISLLFVPTVIAAGAVALAGSAPKSACLVVGSAFALGALAGVPVVGGFWYVFTIGTVVWRTAVSSARAPAILFVLILAIGLATGLTDPSNAWMLVWIALAVALVALAWRRQDRAARLAHTMAGEVLRGQAEAARQAVGEERRRVARELHDVLSHAITLMVVQAGAANALLHTDRGAADAAITEVVRAADRALAESDQLGLVIEQGAAGTPGLGPGAMRRSGHDIHDLVARMSGIGLAVELSDPQGLLTHLSGDGALCAYRVVQEGLTNVLRHAPGASVRVAFRAIPSEIEVVLTDDGGPSREHDPTSLHRGYGLIGLGDRLRAVGGTLSTTALTPRGFQVIATVPARSSQGVLA
ncbi:MAG: histidine kinase [Candidatus Nanopelagicales bacterium]